MPRFVADVGTHALGLDVEDLPQATVAESLLVGHRRGTELKLAETLAEGHVFFVGEELAGEQQEPVVEESRLDGGEVGIRELAERDTGDGRAEWLVFNGRDVHCAVGTGLARPILHYPYWRERRP